MRGLGTAIAGAICLAVFASPAWATTYTVTDPGDSGAGTLRQAITDANTNAGADTIVFSLGGQTIAPATALPAITGQVTIDGTSDPGNVIDGSSAGTMTDGLDLQASNSTIKGIEIDNFDGWGLNVTGGGETIAANTMSFNAAGGITIAGSGNTIGGTGGANTLAGNAGPGLAITANNNVVTGNTIGDFGNGNGGDGVAISGTASGNRIGGPNAGDGNVINSNAGAGVSVTGTGTGNAIVGNAISSNTGLGIDLGTTGVTANDTGDGDTGPNNLQNFPVLSTFTTSAGTSTVTGSLNSTANTSFHIDFYSAPSCDDSGNGEGDTYVGSTTVTTNGSGDATINASLPAIADKFVTATATGPGTDGTGSTSEFSACQAGPPTGAVISNGTVQLGVTNRGDLNYDCAGEVGCPGDSAAGAGPVGLRFVPLNLDSTSPGCPCEGWGAADAGSGLTGYADESTGTANVTVNSFTHTATEAISTVTITDPAHPGFSMQVVQDYKPSALSPNLYEDNVTVTNNGTSDFTDLRYRRAMDWDIEPTAFNEWSTIQGTSPQLLFDSDDGFASPDPLAGKTYIDSESVCGAGYSGACAFTDLGSGGTYPTVTTPDDHGALFDFGFGALAHNASKTFKVYYGAAPDETTALSALSTGGAQVYSLGESNCPETSSTVAGCDALPAHAGVTQGKPATFMFGFVTTTGDLSITKTHAPDPPVVGHDLTWTLTIHNNGPQAAAGVHVEDALPAGVTFKSATPSTGGTCSGTSTVKCDFPSLANNSSATVTIVVTPTATGPLSNTATVSSASADANPANNSATDNSTVSADLPQVSITADKSQLEGNGPGTTNMPFTIHIDRSPTATVSVHYATADGTATTADNDYASTSGTVTWLAGDSADKTVNVPIVGDTKDEPDETFTLSLSSPSGGIVASGAGTRTGTIQNDDSPPSVSVADPVSGITEGNSGTTNMPFVVTLSAVSGKTITVHYATADGTATAGLDYTATSGTLTFNPGDTQKTVNVPVIGDTLDENDETLALTLSTPTNVTINRATATGTIIDDDGPPSVSIADASLKEGNSGTSNMPFVVTLSAASGKTVTVHYSTADGTATQPADYTSTTGTLTFNPGETTKTINVPIVGDTLVEGDETFTVTLDTPSNVTLNRATATGTINDDDSVAPPTVPSMAIGNATVDPEGNSGSVNANFIVQLSGASTQVITVHYATADGTATAGLDYTATSGTLTFTPGQTQQSIPVAVLGDLIPEPDETFTVNLSAPVNATIADGQGLGTIVDDDQISTSGGLFCGKEHRGKCTGMKVKDQFDRPGNASWTFAAYNPPPGQLARLHRARAAAAKKIKLGTVRKKVGKGAIKFVFVIRGAKADKLLAKITKAKIKYIVITRRFTPAGGAPPETVSKKVKLKR